MQTVTLGRSAGRTMEPPRKFAWLETERHAPSIAEIEALLRLDKERVRQLERQLREMRTWPRGALPQRLPETQRRFLH